MFKNIKQDIRRYFATEDAVTFRQKLDTFLYNYSLWVIISYRFGQWIRNELRIPILSVLLKILSRLTHSFLCTATGLQIPFEAKIGPGLYIGHTGMLIINGNTVIGSNCNIEIGVVIGQGGRGKNKGCPVIGNSVFVGVGAKIIGKIVIGNLVAIGANAVVTKDIPQGATVVGVPAKIVNYLGSSDFIRGI